MRQNRNLRSWKRINGCVNPRAKCPLRYVCVLGELPESQPFPAGPVGSLLSPGRRVSAIGAGVRFFGNVGGLHSSSTFLQIKRESTEHSLCDLVIKLSFELFDRGQVIPETSGQGFRDAVIADRLSWSYLSPRPTRLSTCSTCCYCRLARPSFARVGAPSPAPGVL